MRAFLVPSTHVGVFVHVVFSTKNRHRFISPDWRDRLHAYMGGSARREQVIALAVGGVSDHVHLLLALRATSRLSDVMREIKSASSAWVHREIGFRDFGWQDGYGAFSVEPGRTAGVVQYIQQQEERHRGSGFQQEYVSMLDRSGITYDGRYLW